MNEKPLHDIKENQTKPNKSKKERKKNIKKNKYQMTIEHHKTLSVALLLDIL